MLFNWIYLILFLVPMAIRWLAWLNILQMKEYRVDRVTAFLKTKEGGLTYFSLFPRFSKLKKESIKRPKPTARVGVVALISALFIFTLLFWGLSMPIVAFTILLFALLLFIPDLILLANLPISLGVFTLVQILLLLAKLKIHQKKPLIIGITGSYGKTSTKHLLTHLLKAKYSTFTTQKSYNTPYSVALQILTRYKQEEVVVLEFAAYKPKEIKKLAKIFKPHIAVITGLTAQHLSIFGSLENIIKAKAELIESLPERGVVFYNDQDTSQAERIVQYALERTQGIISHNFTSSELKLNYSQPKINKSGKLAFVLNNEQINTNFVGQQYLSIIKGAVAVAKYMQISASEIKKQLITFNPDERFVKFFEHSQGFWIVDDGRTANPAGFKAAIELTEELIKHNNFTGKKFLVTSGLIDLGNAEDELNRNLAKQAKEVFNEVFYTGEPGLKQFQEEFSNALTSDKEKITQAIKSLDSNDLILVEGKLPISVADLLEISQ